MLSKVCFLHSPLTHFICIFYHHHHPIFIVMFVTGTAITCTFCKKCIQEDSANRSRSVMRLLEESLTDLQKDLHQTNSDGN